MQFLKALPSRRHSNVARGSSEWNVNVAVELELGSGGPESMMVVDPGAVSCARAPTASSSPPRSARRTARRRVTSPEALSELDQCWESGAARRIQPTRHGDEPQWRLRKRCR